jgi:hypothetical protein
MLCREAPRRLAPEKADEEQEMTMAERLYGWNCWYDRLPSEWRFQIVLWPLLAVGAINMAISIALWFPFGLLVLIAISFFTEVRVPYFLGWIVPGVRADTGQGWRSQIGGCGCGLAFQSQPPLRLDAGA